MIDLKPLPTGACASDEEFEHLQEILANPTGPSKIILEGAALLERLRHRARCEAEHVQDRVPTNGLGWTGTRCPKCGFSFFGEWEDWVEKRH